MALTTFPSIDAHYGSSYQVEHKRLVAEFGDGYRQRARDGLNSRRETWKVVWKNLNDTDIDTIKAFLDARGSDEAFLWTPPRDTVERKWTCEKYAPRPSGHEVTSFTATFVEEFDLTT